MPGLLTSPVFPFPFYSWRDECQANSSQRFVSNTNAFFAASRESRKRLKSENSVYFPSFSLSFLVITSCKVFIQSEIDFEWVRIMKCCAYKDWCQGSRKISFLVVRPLRLSGHRNFQRTKKELFVAPLKGVQVIFHQRQL